MQVKNSIYFYPFISSMENNCNTVLIDGPEKILIDPGHKHLWPKLRRQIVDDGINPADIKLVLHTHCHPDHMEAGQVLEADYGATQAMSPQEKEFYDGPGLQFYSWMGLDLPGGNIGRVVEEGKLDLGDKVLELYLTPGHTPGSLCIHWPEEGLLVTGDLIFATSYGRTDFVGGSQSIITDSISKMSTLEGVEFLLPGHGPAIMGTSRVSRNFQYVLGILSE
ncbi:MAG: MBL fold metallo-hydrolase [Deltaproteobacteria bacterium]|jgi:glyoxylase-like metal-dependent hydrolase (beta-lactamase superfamily II)|nr:MBL fold metallo-hydrolase [Deltaproteobacteria bacterium]